jgi:hypothetical protein
MRTSPEETEIKYTVGRNDAKITRQSVAESELKKSRFPARQGLTNIYLQGDGRKAQYRRRPPSALRTGDDIVNASIRFSAR